MARPDDEALTWDGDDDPTLTTGRDPEPASRRERHEPAAVDLSSVELPAGWRAVGGSRSQPADPAAHADPAPGPTDPAEPTEPDDDAASSLGNAALVTLGVLGGIFALYSVGWLIAGIRLREVATFLVSPVAFEVTLWLTVLAPPIWFGTVLLLTRRSRAWLRIVLLVAGAALLVPWPFIMVGAIG